MNILAILLLCLVPSIAAVKFKDCGSKTGKITSVNIIGCTTDPCELKKGTNATFSVEFESKADISSLTAVVHGVIAGVLVPFPIPQSNACENCGLQCPLKDGATYTYETYIPVLTSYPTLQVPVEWELKDENADDVFCMELLIQIV